jgi:hypothetical protein
MVHNDDFGYRCDKILKYIVRENNNIYEYQDNCMVIRHANILNLRITVVLKQSWYYKKIILSDIKKMVIEGEFSLSTYLYKFKDNKNWYYIETSSREIEVELDFLNYIDNPIYQTNVRDAITLESSNFISKL